MKFPTFTEWLKQKFPYKTYSETVEHLPNTNILMNEMPHSCIRDTPAELSFLSGYVDFGLENSQYNLSTSEISKALYGKGVSIPGSKYKVRLHSMFLILEPKDDEEPSLPKDWRQCILTMNDKNQFTYIGKRVRQDQTGKIDFSQYEDIGDAWILLPAI